MKKLALVLILLAACICLSGCSLVGIPIVGGLIAGTIFIPKLIAFAKVILVILILLFAIKLFTRKKG